MRRLTEHLWSGIIHRSETGETRKEDDVDLLDIDEFFDYLNNHYEYDQSQGDCLWSFIGIGNTYGLKIIAYIGKHAISIRYNPSYEVTITGSYGEIYNGFSIDKLVVKKEVVTKNNWIITVSDKTDCPNSVVIAVLNKLRKTYGDMFSIKKI
jgi:hypothetical protein